MIWHSQELRCKEQPIGINIVLKGEYFQNENDSVVIIKVESSTSEEYPEQNDNVGYTIELYKRPLTYLIGEEPTQEDIRRKYSTKIKKFATELEKKKYDIIFPTRKYLSNRYKNEQKN